MKIKKYRIGDKIRIDVNYLRELAEQQQSKEKAELETIIKNNGIATIKSKKEGYSWDDKLGGMQRNTQYLINYGWRIDSLEPTSGIPINKTQKVR